MKATLCPINQYLAMFLEFKSTVLFNYVFNNGRQCTSREQDRQNPYAHGAYILVEESDKK